jgi:hypothetical protein
MFLPTGANAELFKNLKISGQLDVQATSARNVTDFATRPDQGDLAQPGNNDRIGDAHTRTMLSADWDLLDDVHARITLVKGGEGAAGAGHDVYGESADTLDNVTARTLVQEANVKIDKLAGLFDTTIGRQFYGEPGDLIVYYGPRNNYGQRVDSLDAFRFDWKGEHMSVTGIAGRTTDGAVLAANSAATTAADVDLRGIVVSCTQHETVKPSVYLYNRVTHGLNGAGVTVPPATVTGKNTNLYVLGAKAKVMVGGFSGHAEFAKNFGDDRTTFVGTPAGAGPNSGRFTGYALLLKGGYKADVADVAAFNPWAEFGMGSGDANFAQAGNGNFQSINTDHRPGGIYGRFDQTAPVSLGAIATGSFGSNGNIASNGLSNRVIYGLGVKATPAAVNQLTVGAAWYRYAFHRVAPESNGLKRSRNIGSEVDVTADWKHSDNVSVGVTLGSFLPGAHIADLAGANATLNPVQMAAADVKIRF